MGLSDIIGQQQLKDRLIRSVQSGQVPHAQLFHGNEGVGALPLAIAYAQYLNCTNKQADDSCGSCPSCIKYNKYAHPDLHFVFPIVKKKKSSGTSEKDTVCDDYISEWRNFLNRNSYFKLSSWLTEIGAENAQGTIYTVESDNILKKLNLKIYEAEYKVMIIWLPEKMQEECANKLLKIIEEPYDKTVFLLVSENPDSVLGTIRSRSQSLHVPPIDKENLTKAIPAKYNLSEEEIVSVVHLSNGSYLKAEEVLENNAENEDFLDLFITIMRNSWTRNIRNMKAKGDYFASMGREWQKNFLSYAQHMIRENFVYRLHSKEINYMNPAESGFSAKFSTYVNERNVIELMDELELAERHIEQNVNPRMIFLDLSMKIAVLLKK
ncbi:MAG: DNA polymerase III subunit delta [Dysgonamonadaceae bacterium]|jgi:DNA polymerase-3 subunit delta'|nr:DNA polymerase III subunit delta [Dysgonamonadaceae bacterium]